MRRGTTAKRLRQERALARETHTLLEALKRAEIWNRNYGPMETSNWVKEKRICIANLQRKLGG